MADEIINNINEELVLPELTNNLPELQDTPEVEEIVNPEPPEPPLTSIDKINKISDEVFATQAPHIDFDYQMGKTEEFSAKRQNFDKYYSYGSDIYGKYGFNPWLPGVDTDGDGKLDKSGMDNLYDENTSDWEDIKRAYRGMMELRQIGLQDTFLFGMFHDDENYKSFGDTMKKYSSSKGGATGFWSNTMLSAGYTVGIIEAIAYEEALLAITTWGAGNIGTSTAMATRLGKGLEKAGKWLNKNKVLKVAEDMQDVGKVKSWLGRRKQAFGKGAKSFLRTVSPVGETVDFIRNADRLSEFTKLQAVATGAASVSRDMRKIYLAHSEGKLEANMAEEEFRDKAWDEWYKMNPNAGVMSKDQLDLINSEAARVNANVYAGNFGLIYLTNAVTFNNLFRSGKSVRRLFNHSSNGLFKITRDATTKKALVQAVGKGAKQYVRNKVKDWTIAGTVKKGTLGTLRSSMEGVQEVGQDILSESFKNYHIRNTLGTQTEGGFLHYLENDLVHAIKRQNSQQGLETFLSGMFMGVFASPVTFANQQLTKFVDGSGFITARGTYDKTFNKEKYKQTQKQEQKKLEEEAERLTKFFNENKTFIKMTSQPIYRQVELQQDMLDAAEKGHMRDFKNSHHASIVNGARTLLEKGMVDDYIEQLEYFASENYTTEDLRELFERPDITDETAPEFRDKLLNSAEILKNLKESYSIIQAALPNPHSVKRLKPGDPLFMETLIKHQAWKDLQTELLFNSSKIADRKQRLESIKKLINDTNPLSAEFTVEALVDETQLEQAVKLLRAEVNANKDLDLTGEASLNALTTEKRLAALEAYQDAILAFKVQAEMSAGIGFVKSESEYYDDMFEAYNKLLEAYGKNTLLNKAAQREINEQSFDLIFDYINLELSTGEFTKYVQTLETTSGRESFLKTREQVLKRLDDNKKEHIKNALQAFYEKRETDQMLKELYDLGFFFELTHLDDLMRKGIMPIEILDLNNNNQPVTDEQYIMAQEVMQKYVSKLIGKKLIRDKFEAKSRGRKLKSDERTVDEIIKEYNISLNKNIDITKKEGQLLLEKVLDPSNKNLTKVDREILVKIITDNSAVLKFVSDQTLPIQINDAGVITIDIRYAGEDYVNSAYSIENLIITALTQNKFINQLKENDDLWLQARMAMRQAKDVYQKNYPDENVDEMPVFNDVNIFLSESLNDLGFQKFLAQIEDNVAPAKKSLWSTVKKGSEAILEEEFAGKLLNRVINIASKAVDDSIVDNISEINIKARTDENEEALNKKVEELKVMAEEMSMKWNVKVKVLKDQNEAREFLDKIENPFYSKEEDVPAGFYDEKTNTAYIIAEDVKANTLYHEIFLHPFLINAEKNNSELYKALVDEARADQTVIDYVEKEYGKESIIGTRQFEHELVGRVYELALANKISEKEKPGLFKRIYEFAKLMLRKTGEFLKILPKDVSKFNPTKTKIKDLAEFSRSQRTGMDLGKVITEPFRPKKKKEKPVLVKKKIKKEEQVNVGGNTIVMNEARDQPGLMEDFIRDDIQFENAESIKTATNEIVELGKELDNIDVLASNTSDLVEVEKGNTKLPLRSNLGSGEQKTLKTEYSVGTNGALGVYVNEQTGSEDVFLVIPNKNSDKDYIGYKRVYKDGKPTNEFSIKASMNTAEKGTSKISFEAVNKVLPEGTVLTETTNISTDGLIMWSNQIKNGYKPLEETITVDVNTEGTKINLGGTKSGGNFSKANFTEQELVKAEAILNDLIKDFPGAKIESRKITPPMIKDALYSIKITIPKLEKPKKEDLKTITKEANWEFGELRLQIDGRLVIDVVANGKRFLMYKSIGKGSTAETKGEWTPLLYFGTKLDKNQNAKEWFVKALFEGKDPKINKYGSKTFIGLDTILKARESELFTGAEEFKTVTYTEEIEVEETPVETKTEKAKEDSEIQLEEDDTLESIVNKIDNIQAQIDEQKKLQESGKLTMREKGRVKRKILRLSIFLNELERERRKKIKEQETTESKLQVKEEDTEFVAELDYNGNEIITPEMPYSRLPESLQLALAEQYGKKRQLLTQDDVDNINKERKTNPVYISIVNEYVEKRLERQNKILGEQEVKINQEKINRAKAKRRAEEEARRKGKKVKLTLEEKIKELAASLKTVSDKPLLTDKEIEDLANKIRNQESLVPFTLADVNNILIDKVRKIELKNKQKDVRKYAEYIAEKRKREKTIKQNVKRLGKSGTVSAPIFKGLDKEGEKQYKRNDLVIPAGMRQFLLKYHPDLFLEETLDVFNEKLSTIMKQYRLDRGPGMTLSQPELEDILKGTPEEIQKGISELLSSLEEKKKAYPVIIKRINAALNEANIPYTIKMLSGSKLANSSSLYEFKFTPNKVKGKNVFSPKKGKFTADQAVIDNFKINEEDVESGFITPSEAARIELAKILLEPGVFLPRGLFENLDSKGTREGLYDSWISEDKQTWPLNIGANVTVAGLGDRLFESLTSYFNLDQNEIAQLAAGKYEYSPVTSVVYELLRDNFTKKALRKAIASEIRDKIQIEEQEELIVPEDLRSFIEYIEWSTSEEGKAILEQELALKAQDIIAFEELYLQEQIAEIQEEERIKKEGNVVYTYFQKDIADQLAKTDKVNEQLTILWDLLNKDLQGNIAFIKSVRNYTKDLNMTNKQKEVNEALLVAQFSGGPLLGKVIQIMNKAYIIQDYVEESNKVELVELDAEQSMRKNLLEVNEVLELAVQELKPGTIFNGKIIDTVANSAEIKYIKDAYSDILTNFTSYTKEAESLSDEKLLEDLKTELRKCK